MWNRQLEVTASLFETLTESLATLFQFFKAFVAHARILPPTNPPKTSLPRPFPALFALSLSRDVSWWLAVRLCCLP
jgi:hypothetical protein